MSFIKDLNRNLNVKTIMDDYLKVGKNTKF